jgi:hypothetical protein
MDGIFIPKWVYNTNHKEKKSSKTCQDELNKENLNVNVTCWWVTEQDKDNKFQVYEDLTNRN